MEWLYCFFEISGYGEFCLMLEIPSKTNATGFQDKPLRNEKNAKNKPYLTFYFNMTLCYNFLSKTKHSCVTLSLFWKFQWLISPFFVFVILFLPFAMFGTAARLMSPTLDVSAQCEKWESTWTGFLRKQGFVGLVYFTYVFFVVQYTKQIYWVESWTSVFNRSVS